MLRYPSWTDMHHVLISVFTVKTQEHFRQHMASHRACPRSIYVGLLLDLFPCLDSITLGERQRANSSTR